MLCAQQTVGFAQPRGIEDAMTEDGAALQFPLLADATISREPAELYHTLPGISCSMLKDYAASPFGYALRHVYRTAPAKTSAAMRAGTLLHLRHELPEEVWRERLVVAEDSACTATGQLGKAGERWLADLSPNSTCN